LDSQVLSVGRDAGIAVNHALILEQIFGTEKRNPFKPLGLFQKSRFPAQAQIAARPCLAFCGGQRGQRPLARQEKDAGSRVGEARPMAARISSAGLPKPRLIPREFTISLLFRRA
jgi:hypothetical protein